MRPEDLRAYAHRDWRAVEELKERFWVERKKEMTPLEALELGDDLRRWLQQVRPDWPTPEDRAEDLARHIRLSEMLRSVRPESLRAPERGQQRPSVPQTTSPPRDQRPSVSQTGSVEP